MTINTFGDFHKLVPKKTDNEVLKPFNINDTKKKIMKQLFNSVQEFIPIVTLKQRAYTYFTCVNGLYFKMNSDEIQDLIKNFNKMFYEPFIWKLAAWTWSRSYELYKDFDLNRFISEKNDSRHLILMEQVIRTECRIIIT
jgi:hypothetical protein